VTDEAIGALYREGRFEEWHAAIQAQAQESDPPRPKPAAPAAPAVSPATLEQLRKFQMPTEPIDVNAMSARMIAAVRSYTQRAIAANNSEWQARLDKSAAMVASLERRLSRQGEHLAALETKVQALQRK
jgi:hypothetical protein